MSKLIEFITNEDGAVTADWVVLTAAIVGLALTTAIAVLWTGGPSTIAGKVETSLNENEIQTTF